MTAHTKQVIARIPARTNEYLLRKAEEEGRSSKSEIFRLALEAVELQDRLIDSYGSAAVRQLGGAKEAEHYRVQWRSDLAAVWAALFPDAFEKHVSMFPAF